MKSNFLEPTVPGFGFARARGEAFSAVRELWKKRQAEGWTQNKLAERLGRDPAWVSRKLSGPANWTLRTFGDLVDAMDGEPEIRIHDLLKSDQLRSNFDAYLCAPAIESFSGRSSNDTAGNTAFEIVEGFAHV